MNEKKLFKMAIIVIVTGFIFLLFYVEEINLSAISSLENSFVEEKIKVKGIVTKISQHETVLFIEV